MYVRGFVGGLVLMIGFVVYEIGDFYFFDIVSGVICSVMFEN